ncbi:hypothetical protein G3I78_47870, partial [Streptomyces sp. SID13726]|nr:hypothetical protein [Streptomyces sp. SID13726]
RARRRIGAAPLRRLFEILAGPVAHLGQAGSFYRGLRTVAVDGTLLHVPDEEALTWRYAKRAGESVEFGYPPLRLVILIECGTRALLGVLDRTMLLLADAGFDGAELVRAVSAPGRGGCGGEGGRPASGEPPQDGPEPLQGPPYVREFQRVPGGERGQPFLGV